MHRMNLVNYKGLLVCREMATALQIAEKKAAEIGKWQMILEGPEAGIEMDNPLSLKPAGREIYVRLDRDDITDPQTKLNALWGFLVPLGFMPHQRYPLADQPKANAFYFLGHWKIILDQLMSEGRGHLAWPSVCAATQMDVGTWAGDNPDQRFVQGQLHRIGKNIGAVDGIIGPRTVEAMESLGLNRAVFVKVQEFLRTAEPPKSAPMIRTTGHVAIPGWDLNIATFGGVKSVQTRQGATLTIDGPGRVIIDVDGGVSK